MNDRIHWVRAQLRSTYRKACGRNLCSVRVLNQTFPSQLKKKLNPLLHLHVDSKYFVTINRSNYSVYEFYD
jgi:hypothetical protein